MKKIALATALILSGLLASTAQAESTFVSGAVTGSTASARLDFTIIIPQVLFLRVGISSSNVATDATPSGIVYTVPATNLGDSSVIAGAGGDLTLGAVTVRVYGNGGNISLNSATTGPLNSGTVGENISWSEISVATAALGSTTAGFTNAAITHPAFNTSPGGGAGTATTLTAAVKVVRVEGKWTYTYLNTTVPAAGTYGGTVAKNGRVTYTATQL